MTISATRACASAAGSSVAVRSCRYATKNRGAMAASSRRVPRPGLSRNRWEHLLCDKGEEPARATCATLGRIGNSQSVKPCNGEKMCTHKIAYTVFQKLFTWICSASMGSIGQALQIVASMPICENHLHPGSRQTAPVLSIVASCPECPAPVLVRLSTSIQNIHICRLLYSWPESFSRDNK